MTLAAWANPTASGAANVLNVGNKASTHRNSLAIDASLLVSGTAIGASTNGTATSSSAMSLNVWAHMTAVFSTQSSRRSFLNGSGGTTNTTNIGSQNTADYVAVGTRFANNAAGVYFNGHIAEVGVWAVALTDAEIASLASGVTPDKVRPQSLVFYAPLIRDLIDPRGGLTITNNNAATVSNHPRIYA